MFMLGDGVLDPALVSQLAQQAGPAALAALAVWWLTNKHEKAIDKITTAQTKTVDTISEGISNGHARVAESLDKMDARHEARDKERHEQDEQNIKILTGLVSQITSLDDKQKETNRRLEIVEKVVTDVHRITTTPQVCGYHTDSEKKNGKPMSDSVKSIDE